MSVRAFFTIWTRPSKSIELGLNSVQEILACDYSLLRHVICSLSRVLVVINLICVHNSACFTLCVFEALLALKQRGQKHSGRIVSLLLLFGFMLRVLDGLCTSLRLSMFHLVLNTLNVAAKQIGSVSKGNFWSGD